MLDSISSYSSSSVQSTSTSQLSEEEKKKKKAQEEGLFSYDNKQNTTTQDSGSTTQITEDSAKSTAKSYIASLKAQYPQLAAKLDSYYSSLDFSTLCADAASLSDIKAYIYSETKGFLN